MNTQQKARALAEAFGVKVEWDKEAGLWWVWPPSMLAREGWYGRDGAEPGGDPYLGQHMAYDKTELYEMVAHYAWHASCQRAGIDLERAEALWLRTDCEAEEPRVDRSQLIRAAIDGDIFAAFDLAEDNDPRILL